MNLKQEFYENYCFALTATHNFVVSENLLNTYSLSWGIVSGYYSIMTVGRMCCNIGKGDYPEKHAQISDLLAGQRTNYLGKKTQKNISRIEFIEDLLKYNDTIDEQITELGKELISLRKIRNDSNYEQFIVPHQFYHIELDEPLKEFVFRLKQSTTKWLKFGIELFLKYVELLEMHQEFLGLITDKHISRPGITIWKESYYWGYKKFLIELRCNGAKKEVIELATRIWEDSIQKYESKAVPIAEIFYQDMTFGRFDQKKTTMKNFVKKLNKFPNHNHTGSSLF